MSDLPTENTHDLYAVRLAKEGDDLHIAWMPREWAVADVRCFDLFPQTAHVETVVEVRCASS
jgi:hypothetical protein